MHGALMFRWGRTIPGREAASLEVFGAAIKRFEALTKEGRIHGHREYMSITGRGGGFTLVEGETEELTKLLTEEESLRLNIQSAAVTEDFEIQTFVGGTDQAVQQAIGNYTTGLHDIGYM